MEGKLPNLIVIGAMKCGTTSLHDYLNQHPDIFMSEKKELDFFIKERAWKFGLDWYKNQFATHKKIRGESSQDYSKFHWWKGVPMRIKSVLGDDVKFIYIIRNPIERIYSHYYEMQAQNCAPDSLERHISANIEDNEIVLTSCYGKQIKKYFDHFDRKQFFFTSLEKLKADKLKVLNEICQFTGISEYPADNELNFIKNASESKRTRNAIGKYLNETIWIKQIKSIIPSPLKNHLKGKKFVSDAMSKPIKTVQLSENLQRELTEFFREDFELFQSLTDKSALDLGIRFS